jgi:hypothetical protein
LSSGRTPEAADPASKSTAAPKPRRTLFEGDTAAVELRSRLARTRDGAPLPPDAPAPASGVSLFSGVLRFIGVALTAAAVAGAAGYLAGGVKLSLNPARIAAPSGEAEALPSLAAQLNASNRNAPLPVAQTAAVDVARAGAGAARAAQWPGPLAAPPLPQPDVSEIAARLKLGADLMAEGDIAAARTMFARVAEAGEAAGAFALAETYDPAVLGAMRLRGGIIPDPARARRWYEKAREMGSDAAPERIARLTAR